jgi:hypothetical protein
MRWLLCFLLLGTGIVFLSGCGENGPSSNAGTLQIYLTDAPVELTEVSVTLDEIEVHQTGGEWKPFKDTPTTFDLLDLEGTQSLLALGNLEDGMYTGFRLQVTEGHIVEDGEECELTVPSGKIEVPVVFEIQEGEITKIVADFDAEESVHIVHTGENTRCILRPVLVPVSVTNE